MNTTEDIPSGILLGDGEGNKKLVRLVPIPGYGGWADVEVSDPTTGKVLALPFRLKMSDSGGRLAGQRLTTDPSVCITDEQGLIADS